MIPEEKSAAVTRGLHEAFGVTGFEDIRKLTSRPTSNLVFRIVVRGSPFLLKIATRKGDPARSFTCMRAAAEAGLAPHVWYTSVEDRVAITDFVEAAPFPVTDALVRIPTALRTLHALPPFPGVPNHLNTTCMFLINKGTAVDEFIRKFRAANVLSEGETEELLSLYAQLAAVYPRHDPDMVSSHNDLFKPDNILFDGHRVWLVDWEAAFLNDRYADLAVVANMVVSNDAEERAYLHEYFGQPPDQYQRARFFLMRQVAHIFYALGFLWLGSSGTPLSRPQNVPKFRDFHRRIWAGEVDLADNETKIVYGSIHREQVLQNTQQPRFEEALRIVSDRHACV
ncbi:MAG TPA: phosphotransferase [Bryobacteraceae bacterium]|nr:phosphotransferase [Bryobacteraceae bacterium]